MRALILKCVFSAGLTLLSSCSPTAAAQLPTEAMWAEFKGACWKATTENFHGKAIEAGWMPFEPVPNSYFAKQRAYAQAEAAKVTGELPSKSFSATDRLYSKRLNDRDIYLWVAPGTVQNEGDRYEVVSCSIADPDAREAIPFDAVAELGGKPPVRFGGDLATGYRWEPGLDRDQVNTVVLFFPQTSQKTLAAAGVEMRGLIMKQQTIRRLSE